MRNPTTGIMVNAGIFVNIANPKNMPESKIGIRLLLSSSKLCTSGEGEKLAFSPLEALNVTVTCDCWLLCYTCAMRFKDEKSWILNQLLLQ